MDAAGLARDREQLGRDPQQGQGKKMLSPVDRAVYSFDEELEDVSESESEMIPLWLQEFPDDMDVLIAQRNFEDAVTLVLKVNDHLVLYPKCYEGFFQNDLRLRVNHKIQELVERISHELDVSTDRSPAARTSCSPSCGSPAAEAGKVIAGDQIVPHSEICHPEILDEAANAERGISASVHRQTSAAPSSTT